MKLMSGLLIFPTLMLGCRSTSTPAESYNILVTTVGVSQSQNLVMYRLAELLGQRGHNVTVLKVEAFTEVKRMKLKYSQEISYPVFTDPEEKETLRLGLQDNAWNTTQGYVKFGVIKRFFHALSDSCRKFIEDESTETFSRLKSRKYDVIIIHLMDFCSFGLAHRLNIKGTVWMSTAFSIDFMSWYAGAPTPVSYVPAGPNPLPTTAGFADRLKNGLFFLATNALFQYGVVRPYDHLFRRHYGPDFPGFSRLLHSTQLHFVNSDPLFEYARPVLHKMIYVGGLTMERPEPLDQKWQKIADESTNGIIVFSLGSVANTTFMPLELKRDFINAFKRLKQTVIWRLEGDSEEARQVPNIVIADWIPQKDLLMHPNVRAFLTHGGYNSLTEATYVGVPLVMFPLFGDQYANCRRVERLNVGVTLPRDGLSEEEIFRTLDHVINNQTIQNNARRLGRMIRKKPLSSKDAAVQWTEFLAEFQTIDQLTPDGQKLSLVEYFMIDVLLCVTLSILSILLVCFYLCYRACAKACIKRRVDKGKPKVD